MPAVFPMPATGGPKYRLFLQQEPEYHVTTSPEYGDGGKDTALRNTTPTRRWVIEYDGLTPAEATTLDDHFDSCYGTHLGFGFTDPRTSTVYANVKYDRYERAAHVKKISLRRRVVLIKRP